MENPKLRVSLCSADAGISVEQIKRTNKMGLMSETTYRESIYVSYIVIFANMKITVIHSKMFYKENNVGHSETFYIIFF